MTHHLRYSVMLALLMASITVVAAPIDTKPVLWRSPGSVEHLDLFWGMGSTERAPKAPFVFVAEDTSGSKPKIQVKDEKGVLWTVKLAPQDPAQNEVHAEIAASRLVWALGYCADENYFVPEAQVGGTKNLKRAASVIGADGSIRHARFERLADGAQKLTTWDVEKNRFKGSRELAGLHVLMMILGNWDLPAHNTWVYRVTTPGAPDVEERYVVTDLGSTFGRMRGGLGSKPTRWNLKEYRDARIVSDVVGANLRFKHPLTGSEPLQIPLEHVRWFLSQATRLSDAQVRQAFTAAGAPAQEAEDFAAEVMKRIDAIDLAAKRRG